MKLEYILPAIIAAGFLTGLSTQAVGDKPEERSRAPALANSQIADDGKLELTNDLVDGVDAKYAQRILERFSISDEMIATGRFTAVSQNRSDPVTNANFNKVLVPGVILIDQVRSESRELKTPAFLMAEHPSAKTYALSWEIITADGRLSAHARDRTGLNYDGASAAYLGEFDVALVKKRKPEDRSTLSESIAVSVNAPRAANIEPSPLRITRLREWSSVAITVPDVTGDAYEVTVSADPADGGDKIMLPVTRPTVAITVTPESIVGWGIGKTRVTVKVKGMRQPDGYQIALSSSHGALETDSVTLNQQGKGGVWLWSSRHRGTSIAVQDTAFIAKSRYVPFEAPWLYLALAIAGGLIGAFIRGRGQDLWIRAFAVGALSGLLMALMYSVGINWLGRAYPDADLARGGEAIVFVLGALGALLGVKFALPKD